MPFARLTCWNKSELGTHALIEIRELTGLALTKGGFYLNLEIDTQKTSDQIALVHLKGEIDLHTCSLLRDTLRELIEQGCYRIVINLAEVPYLDSAALGVLVDAVRRVREHEGGISLVSTTPFVRRAFEITRLVKIFQLYEDNETALADIRAQAAPV